MAALQLEKHLYCAKPITHTIHEARRVRDAVLKAGVITQTSAQGAASSEARGTEEILRSGVLGPIREVHVWTPHPIYPCSLERPKEAPPDPRWPGLGPVAGTGSVSPVPSGLRAVQVGRHGGSLVPAR